MAEQLALEKALWQRRTVDRDDLTARATAVLMDKLGDEFLARSALAHDHHRRIGARDAPGEVDGLTECRRNAKERDFVAVAVLLQELNAKITRLARDHHGV